MFTTRLVHFAIYLLRPEDSIISCGYTPSARAIMAKNMFWIVVAVGVAAGLTRLS